MTKENFIQLPSGVYLVCGHIASGKSSLLQSFKKWIPDSVVIDETPPTENPHFVEYCQAIEEGKVPNPFAFGVQKYFLEDAEKQGEKINQMEGKVVFWGGSPWHHFMYVWLLYRDGSLSKEYYDKYCCLFAKCISFIPIPKAGIITLRETGESTRLAIIKRVENSKGEEEIRARSAEIGIPIAYLKSQIDYWEERKKEELLLPEKDEPRLRELSPQIPILKLNTDKIDWRIEDEYGNQTNDNDGVGQMILSQLMIALAQQ